MACYGDAIMNRTSAEYPFSGACSLEVGWRVVHGFSKVVSPALSSAATRWTTLGANYPALNNTQTGVFQYAYTAATAAAAVNGGPPLRTDALVTASSQIVDSVDGANPATAVFGSYLSTALAVPRSTYGNSQDPRSHSFLFDGRGVSNTGLAAVSVVIRGVAGNTDLYPILPANGGLAPVIFIQNELAGGAAAATIHLEASGAAGNGLPIGSAVRLVCGDWAWVAGAGTLDLQFQPVGTHTLTVYANISCANTVPYAGPAFGLADTPTPLAASNNRNTLRFTNTTPAAARLGYFDLTVIRVNAAAIYVYGKIGLAAAEAGAAAWGVTPQTL